jgi:hypothetical protein
MSGLDVLLIVSLFLALLIIVALVGIIHRSMAGILRLPVDVAKIVAEVDRASFGAKS